jgi:glycosyltransferase involved in cell wall biosynthesis
MSIASLEARCVGVPVVAMNHGGVGDVITHGEHGFLASNMSEFIGYIVKILKDPALREKISQQTLQGVEKFSWPSAVDKYTEYYTRAITQNAKRKLS